MVYNQHFLMGNLFTGFQSYTGIVLLKIVFLYSIQYKQPPPSLHRHSTTVLSDDSSMKLHLSTGTLQCFDTFLMCCTQQPVLAWD